MLKPGTVVAGPPGSALLFASSTLSGNAAQKQPQEQEQGGAGVHKPRHRPSLLTDGMAALLTSSFFAFAFYPFHRVKTVMQVQDTNPLVRAGEAAVLRAVLDWP